MRSQQIRLLTLIIGVCILSYNTFSAISYNLIRASQNEHFNAIPFQKGMSFTTWGSYSYNSDETKEEFRKMKDIGIEWIAVNHWWYQDYLNSTSIYEAPGSDSFANVTECFLYAKSIGLHILYKPMLNLMKTYDWRSYIYYTDEWMGNYTAWMVQCAKAAEAGQAEILCLGTEMGNMQVHPDGVREMIHQVRDVYHGLLTYSANHDSFMQIEWYDALDIIGVSMYTMMTVAMDPSASELQKVWDGMYYELEELSMKWNKFIAFTEIGIQARDGSNMIPNDNQISNEKDISEMENFYLSLFQSRLWKAAWFKGAYWWIWDFQPRWDTDLKNFNPVIIKDMILTEYSKEHTVESPIIPLLRSLIPLVVSGIMFIVLIWKKGFENSDEPSSNVIGPKSEGFTNTKPLESLGTSRNGDNDMILGLLFGVFFANIFSSTTLQIFNLIYKVFSYAVILQLSSTTVMISFLGLILIGLIASILIMRYYPKLTLMVLFFLVICYPYFSLGNYIQTVFLKFACDFLVLFLLGVAILLYANKSPIQNILRVLRFSVLVIGIYIGLLLFFDLLAQIFLGVPIGIMILAKKTSKDDINNPIIISDPNVNTTPVKVPDSAVPRMAAFLWGIALIAGILISFGNSVINLIRMTYLALAYYYLPAFIALFGFFFFIWIFKLESKINTKLMQKQIFSPNIILIYGLCAVGLGFLYTIMINSAIFWSVISGGLMFLFLGITILGYAPKLLNSRLGRNYLFLIFIGTFYIIGFLLNGIKGALIYVVTFLIIKDGSFVRRDPKIDPVPNFDVSLVLNSIVLAVAFILVLILLSYSVLQRKLSKNK